jgi:hypothetical protein
MHLAKATTAGTTANIAPFAWLAKTGMVRHD